MSTVTSQRLLGAGLALPLAPIDDGRLAVAEGPEKVRQSIAIILETEPGERIMLPAFGCGLRRFLMQPNTTATRAQIQRTVENALLQWEPRIRVTRIDVLPGPDPSLVVIAIDYTLAADGRRDNLIYPFYLE